MKKVTFSCLTVATDSFQRECSEHSGEQEKDEPNRNEAGYDSCQLY